MIVIVADFLNEVIFRAFSAMRILKFSCKLLRWRRFWRIKSYIDAKSAETNESRFDKFVDFRYDVRSICKTCDRVIDRIFEECNVLNMTLHEMKHRCEIWYLELNKRYTVKQVLLIWALRWRREWNRNRLTNDSFDNVIDVSQIFRISHLTLRSHWFSIYVIWLYEIQKMCQWSEKDERWSKNQ